MRLLVLSFAIIGFWITFSPAFGASLVDEISRDSDDSTTVTVNLQEESIEKISASKKIYIITDSSRLFKQGDFISVLDNNALVFRGLVAKSVGGLVGVKMVRVYSGDLVKVLYPGKKVQLLRGDDSYFNKSLMAKAKEDKKPSIITDEEDLFNETTFLKEDIVVDDDKSSLIKQDNIFAFSIGQVRGYNQPSVSWSYQLNDNIWGEVSYGRNLINDFPEVGLDTSLSNLVVRAKYTIAAPAFSFLQFYVGYQIVSAISPSAGEQDPNRPIDPRLLQHELDQLEGLRKNAPVAGVTLLRRLVPGWFVRADLGSDVLSAGVGLEF